jgi:Ca2+-binding EF-hand superfamily protein
MSFMRQFVILLMGIGLAAGGLAGWQSRGHQVASAADVTAPAPRSAPAAGTDVRDVLLLLDEAPLHLRLHLTLDGVSLSAARSAYVDKLMQSLDTNGDGKLSPEEAAKSPLQTPRRRGSGGAFLNTLDGNRTLTRNWLVEQVDKVGGETVVYRQDVAGGNNDLEVFKFLDADGSGYIDAAEMAAAATKILERDSDQDECISFQEFLPVPEVDPDMPLLVQPAAASEKPASLPQDQLMRDISEPIMPGRLLKKYDKNRDKKLTPDELGWEPARLKMLDRNNDGKLDQNELAGIAATPVDLELAIDLAGAPEGKSDLVILATAGKRIDDTRRPDVLRIAFPKAVLTLSFRKVDPIKSAIEKAMQSFNRIDADNNGYLDAKETAMLIRFERGLFDALDADGDGKIFGEEMEKYVRVRGEPMATTARVNVYDTGRGFFESLDLNSDGRISMREMKSAGKSLQSMVSSNSMRLSPRDPARNFHIEFLRGSFVLFGPTDQMISQTTPSFEQRTAIGPIWFQRMDRNNDGDLTWNEFLGPRDIFHRIDKDGDGLIDPQEAAAATEE